VRFYGGLRRDIQYIVDYKEYHSIQRLFHLSMLAEKELQGRQQQRRSNTVTPQQPPNQHPLRAFVRQRLHPPLAHTAPRLLLHVDTTTVAPRCLRVLKQRIIHPTHPRAARQTLSATAAKDLVICSGIAQANGRTLPLATVGMLVLLMLKMKIL